MKVYNASGIKEVLQLQEKYPEFTLFSGGSDLTLHLEKDSILGLINISHIQALKKIEVSEKTIHIGALVTISMLLESKEIEKYLPLLYKACKTFASHQIRNVATIAGNIINDSPVADLISPLLVLDTKITLASLKGERSFLLEELFDGFKSLKMSNEMVLGFEIPLEKGDFYYRKVGGRKQLNISKLSLALFHTQGRFRLSGASLNSYVQRFKNIEKLLESEAYSQDELFEAIDKDISPHSNARYKKRVFYNLLEEALGEIQ